jgi:hypothetical protein
VKSASAFQPMRARLDPAVTAELPAQPEKPTAPIKENASKLPPDQTMRRDTADHRGQSSDPVTVEVQIEISLELANRPEKSNCAWAYIERKNPPGIQRLGVVLNSAYWPTDGALARGDKRAVRWLASLAMLDRLNTWFQEPALKAARDHLVRSTLGGEFQLWQTGLWAAYALKDSEILAPIDKLPIYGASPAKGPHLVASFPVTVCLPQGRSPEVRVRGRGNSNQRAVNQTLSQANLERRKRPGHRKGNYHEGN